MKFTHLISAASLLTSLLGCAEPSPLETEEGSEELEPKSSDLDAPAALQANTRTGFAEVTKVTGNGSGCPAGKWTHASKPDANGTLFYEISFQSFGLKFDETSTATAQMKNCELWVDLKFEKGRKGTIQRVRFSGERSLGLNQVARVETAFGWSGQTPERDVVTFLGPTDPGYESFTMVDDRIGDNFSVCDTSARLIINISTSLDTILSSARRPSGYISMGTARGDISITNSKLGVQLEMKTAGCAD